MGRDFISAKTGTSIFAYTSSVFTCLFIIAIYFFLMYVNILEWVNERHTFYYSANILNLLGITLMACAVPNLIFSINLLVGLKKNHPSYLKGYFVYGVVMMVLVFLILTPTVLILREIRDIEDNDVIRIFGVTIVSFFIYSLVLVMVSKARTQMLAGEIYRYKNIAETIS